MILRQRALRHSGSASAGCRWSVDASAKLEPKKESSGIEFSTIPTSSSGTSFRRRLRIPKPTSSAIIAIDTVAPAGEPEVGKDVAGRKQRTLTESVNEQSIKRGRRWNWYFFDDAVVMDVAGDFVPRKLYDR